MRRAFAALVLTVGLAGCGGSAGDAPLDLIAYEVRLAPLDDVLARTFERDTSGVAADMRGLAHELESVSPPVGVGPTHVQLVQVLRYLAEDVEEDDALALADDWERLQDVVYEFRAVGIEPFDGPDDE